MKIRDYSLLLIPVSGPSVQDDEHLALIDTWVIDAIQDICNEWDWDCLKTSESLTSIAHQAEYTLKATACSILAITNAIDDRRIIETTERELKENGFDLEEENSTTSYFYPSGYDETTKQNKIKFQPVPSTSTIVYEISEKKRIDDLTADSECPLPIEFKQLIMCGAKIRIYQHNLKFDNVKLEYADFKTRLGTLKNTIAHNIGKGLRKGVSDITDSNPSGPMLDPSHYRNER